MGYPVRRFDPQTVYFITSRTMQSRFLMAPSAMTNELLGAALARAVRQSGVELFAYVFMSNHFHALVRAPAARAVSKFMQRLESDIAIKVGRYVKWRSKFWGRRYSAEEVVDDEGQVDRLEYILSHGVKEGLVSEVRKWPGLSCAQSLLEGGTATLHRWRNWTLRWKMQKQLGVHVGKFSKECPMEEERLSLTPLPCWANLPSSERTRRVEEMVARIDAKASKRAWSTPKDIFKRICAQDPRGVPSKTEHTPRPKAHAADGALWIQAVERYRSFLGAFRKASKRWLAGDFEVEFPPHCFRPPTWIVVPTVG